jgi:Resolvase, N terminal domain
MAELKIGYARVSTVDQDLTAQREALAALGVDRKRIYVDPGLTGTNRDRPGLRQALAACRHGDTLVVTKLDRLARSVPDVRDIVDELTTFGVSLNIGGLMHDPTDPIGRLLFTTLSMIAEFEADLARSPGFIDTQLDSSIDDVAMRGQIRRTMNDFGLPPSAVARAIAFAIEQPDDTEIGDITIRPTV